MRLVLPVAIAMLAAGCAADSHGVAPSPAAPRATAYDVYRAVLGTRTPGRGEALVVLDETTTFASCSARIGGGVGDEWRSALEHYHAENSRPERLDPGQWLGLSTVFINRARFEALLSPMRGWQDFHAEYPGGVLLTLSAVGFDPDRTRAVVQIGTQCGLLCGEWRDYYLVGQGGSWTVTPLQTCRAIA
ncbi:MAG: hypothetical protein AB7U83_13955 [Vicinamibacterales bacterium]